MASVKRAEFDIVHDIQILYRRMLYALSYPGRIYPTADIGGRFVCEFDYNKTLLMAALCVSDAEVRCCVAGGGEAGLEAARYIRSFTYSPIVDSGQADYLFVSDCGVECWQELARTVKRGTLIDPHDSATLFIDVETVGRGRPLRLTGPGIRGEQTLCLTGIGREFLAFREAVNDFPVGVDAFLCDRAGRMTGIPRTTKIKWEDESWPT